MSFQNQQIAYAQTVATTPTYWPIILNRAPTPNDTNYKVGQFWIAQLPNGTKELFYLASQSNMVTSSNPTGALQSTWELISVNSALVSLSDNANTVVFPSLSTATPPDNIQFVAGSGISIVATPASNLITITNTGMASTETLTGNDGTPVSPSGGTIQTLGVTVANATYGQALYTNSGGGNIENFNIQLAAAIASTNVAKVGVAAFSSTQFAVDANGFVTLAGGSTPPILGITPDAHTGPGTSPVIPNGSGNIKIEGGATFATGTQANPIRTNSLAANTLDLQIQLAGSHAATSTADDFGVAQFDANMFTVTSGFVQVKNAGTTGVVTEVIGDDSNAVVPASGTGAITLDGVTVANATHAKPVYFAKNAASTEELDVQVAAAISSTNVANVGLAAFSSAQFAVDSNGFVTLTGGSGPGIQTLTGNTGGPISPSSGNINTLGTGSITIAGAGSTLTTQLTGLTQYDVLVGQGSATIGLITPSATSGVPLISQGSTSYPVFGTAVVAGGGTGDTSFTAYSVITGGTTSTDALQNVSGVGTSGQVLTSNGAGALPTWQSAGANALQIDMDAGTSPIAPSSDVLIFTGAQVATGVVGANVIRTDGTAANAMTIQIQRSTTSAVSNSTLNGVSHFSSTNFTVDANGFVQFVGTTPAFPWTDEGGNFAAASNNGYFVTAIATGTLPPTPAQGDVVKIVATSTNAVTVKGNTGQKIRLGNVITASAGTAVSTKAGDALNLVYRSSDAVWYAFDGAIGSWTLT